MVAMRPGAVAAFLTIDVVLVLDPRARLGVRDRGRIARPDRPPGGRRNRGGVHGPDRRCRRRAGGADRDQPGCPDRRDARRRGVSDLARGVRRFPAVGVGPDCARGRGRVLGVVARGAATSGLNPKALLLFVAVLPQFVDRHGGVPVAAQIAVLGAIHTANCAVAYLGLGRSPATRSSDARQLPTPSPAHRASR